MSCLSSARNKYSFFYLFLNVLIIQFVLYISLLTEFDAVAPAKASCDRAGGQILSPPASSWCEILAQAQVDAQAPETWQSILERQHGAQDWRLWMDRQAQLPRPTDQVEFLKT